MIDMSCNVVHLRFCISLYGMLPLFSSYWLFCYSHLLLFFVGFVMIAYLQENAKSCALSTLLTDECVVGLMKSLIKSLLRIFCSLNHPKGETR